MDFRAYLTQSLVNVPALENYIAAKHNFAAAKLSAEDAREMVVLTVGNAYLLCLADAARIAAVNAELATSKLSLDQATASHDAGDQSAAGRSARAGGLPERAAGADLHHQPAGQGQAGAGARHRVAAGPGVSA